MNASVSERARQLARRVEARCLQRGWDVSELARQAGLSRTTVHFLLSGQCGHPRRSTIARLARAFGISPAELSDDAVGKELHSQTPEAVGQENAYDRRTNPLISEVAGSCPSLFLEWTPAEWDELYSTFGVGGELTEAGVRSVADSINRKRQTLQQLRVVLETHLGEVAMQFVETLYRMVQPVQNLELSATLERLIQSRPRLETERD